MIRRKGPILAAAVIAAFALGWYRGLFGVDQMAPTATPPVDAAKTAETPSTQAANPSPPADPGSAATTAQPAAPAGAPAAPATDTADTRPETPAVSTTPGFDVVRVEPDGSTVVAGKGAANEAITLTDGTRTYGETRTDANGDFVMTLSLPTGSHRLQLAQRDDAISDAAAVVNVPPPGKPDQLLVMMQRPGEASEILQRPEEAPTVASAAEVAPPATSAAPAADELRQENPETEVAAVSPPASPTDAPRDAQGTPADLSVEAVEIEGDRLFVAGSAKNSSSIRIYLDDQPVAEVRSGAGDRFIASAKLDVPVGDHTIRADAVDAGGRVVGRVEVPFQRPEGNTMAAVAAAPGAGQEVAAAAAPVPQTPAAPAAPNDGEATGPSPAGRAPPQAATGMASAPVASETEPAPVTTAEAPPAALGSAAGEGEPQAVLQAPLQASPSRVIIRRGDTLWRISRETYGRGSRYTVIYLANGDQIRDPDRIYPGQVFRMPNGEEQATPPRG